MNSYFVYNEFFNENICHICKIYSDNFITCDVCRIVTYCSEEHKDIHSWDHRHICAAIETIPTNDPDSDIRLFSQSKWIQRRKELIKLIKPLLSRELQPYEIQMIMLRKSCLVCHQELNLYTCLQCYSTNYCTEHLDAFQLLHSCKDLRLCFDIRKYAPYASLPALKFSTYPDDREVTDMKTFVSSYVLLEDQNSYEHWDARHFLYSEYTSNPLTLIYGMSVSNLLDTRCEMLIKNRTNYVVHVIGSVDKKHLSYWEIFLHIISTDMHLKVVLIGKELLHDDTRELDSCQKCCTTGRKITVDIRAMLYHNYASSELYAKPNVIIGFHADFCDEDTWAETILALRNQNCPLFLTSESRQKIEANISKLHEVLGTPLNILYNDENKFHSLAPCRNFGTNEVFYRNKYLAAFKILYSPLFSSLEIT